MRASDPSTSHRTFISYIDRTREFYSAQGYDQPYQWARNSDAPFTPLAKPLAESRVALVTTASPFSDQRAVDGVLRGGKKVCSGLTAEPPEKMFTDDLSWDKETTHTDDVESFLPITRLREHAAEGRIGDLGPRYFCVPTDYSQRRTNEQDAPEILRLMREDAVDVALLVPL
jgi:hypothetical protein